MNLEFTKDLVDLLYLTPQKCNMTNFLTNNFKENIHYIKIRNNNQQQGVNIKRQRGGLNKINYYLTEEAFELVKNTFNLKHRYVRIVNDNFSHVNILMSLENQTIGFIENAFKNCLEVKRQYKLKNYYVDLYFPAYKLVVECDENNHERRNKIYEKDRENSILELGNIIIRFNPNDNLFDLSLVLQNINKIMFHKGDCESKVIIIQFDA